MSYLDDGGKVIDTMFGLPDKVGFQGAYDSMKPSYRDAESRDMAFPAQYMFKNVPDLGELADPIAYAVEQMDKYNIEKGMLPINVFSPLNEQARDRSTPITGWKKSAASGNWSRNMTFGR